MISIRADAIVPNSSVAGRILDGLSQDLVRDFLSAWPGIHDVYRLRLVRKHHSVGRRAVVRSLVPLLDRFMQREQSCAPGMGLGEVDMARALLARWLSRGCASSDVAGGSSHVHRCLSDAFVDGFGAEYLDSLGMAISAMEAVFRPEYADCASAACELAARRVLALTGSDDAEYAAQVRDLQGAIEAEQAAPGP